MIADGSIKKIVLDSNVKHRTFIVVTIDSSLGPDQQHSRIQHLLRDIVFLIVVVEV